MKSTLKIPIVDDVRRAREALAKDCEYNLRKLVEMLRNQERVSGRHAQKLYDSGKS